MTKGVFAHRPGSIYDDIPEERYQFPKQYLKDASSISGNWIIYYQPRRDGGRMGYFALARVQDIKPDPVNSDMYVALIEPQSYVPFESFVDYRDNETFMESGLAGNGRRPNQGLIRKSIRPISDQDFYRIISRGFTTNEPILPREQIDDEAFRHFEVREEHVSFEFDGQTSRDRVSQIVSRPIRDRAFRKQVLEAYNSTCAFTGLQFFNGGGRAEVQAAHIKPVEQDGPDSVRNGLALSGTVHWMFDRGLISLDDDYRILVSRQTNNPDQIVNLIHDAGYAQVPDDEHMRPHPHYLNWHRENCFKH